MVTMAPLGLGTTLEERAEGCMDTAWVAESGVMKKAQKYFHKFARGQICKSE